MKINSLVDEELIDALYDASRAGVPIDLVVRGMCALRPGMPGLSETIRVRSILGRFLEHSRVFRFCDGGRQRVLLGSSDVMPRNLDRRVEALVQVTDAAARRRIIEMLNLAMEDRVAAWRLDADGNWRRGGGPQGVDYQAELISRLHGSAVQLSDSTR